MAIERFTRSRSISITTASSYTLDYSIPANKQLSIFELFASSNTSGVYVEVLYSSDNGTTWSNPWDADSDMILKVFLAGYVPVCGKPDATWFNGGTNIMIRVKITNPTANTASVFFLVKGWERDA